MRGMARVRAALAAGLVAVAWAGPVAAASVGTTEYVEYLPVWLNEASGAAPIRAPSLLNMPPGWQAGDAMAVVAPGGAWPQGARDRLVSSLLDAGAAVLEVNELRGAGNRHAALRAELAAALRTARRAFGAGLVVVFGQGEAGDAALDVAAEAVDPAGERYAAAVRLGPGAPGFDLAEVPELFAFPERPGMLCGILAGAMEGEPGLGAGCATVVARR